MNVEWWNKRTVRKLEKYLYTPLCLYYILDYHRLFFIIIINQILLIVIRILGNKMKNHDRKMKDVLKNYIGW